MRSLRYLPMALAVCVLSAGQAHATAEAVFSSANQGSSTYVIADKLIAVMDGAQESIDIAVAHFNSQRIASALIALHAQRNQNDDPADDIAIRVVLDMGEYGDRRSKSRQLEAAGITVRYKTYSLWFHHPESQLMHHKFLIVDGQELVTGSYNWSDTAEHSNYENVIHWFGRNVRQQVEDFSGEFEKMWDLGRDRYPAFLDTLRAGPEDAAWQPVIPIHFNSDYFDTPMTLTRDEVADIRSEANAAGLFQDRDNKTERFLDRTTGEAHRDQPEGTFLAPVAAPAANADEDRDDIGIVEVLEREAASGND